MGEVRSRRTSTSGQSFLARCRPSNGHSERATWQREGRLEDELRKNPSPPPPSSSASSSSPSFFSPVCGLVLFPFYEQSKSNVMVRILPVEWRVQLLPETARHQLIPSEKMGGKKTTKKTKTEKKSSPCSTSSCSPFSHGSHGCFWLTSFKGSNCRCSRC